MEVTNHLLIGMILQLAPWLPIPLGFSFHQRFRMVQTVWLQKKKILILKVSWLSTFPRKATYIGIYIHVYIHTCIYISLEVNHHFKNGGSFLDDDKPLLSKKTWFANTPIKTGGWTSRAYISFPVKDKTTECCQFSRDTFLARSCHFGR